MIDILNALYFQTWAALMTAGPIASNLYLSAIVVLKLVFGGWALARAGRSPLWVLALLPTSFLFPLTAVDVVALWVFAYIRWPFLDKAGGGTRTSPDEDAVSTD